MVSDPPRTLLAQTGTQHRARKTEELLQGWSLGCGSGLALVPPSLAHGQHKAAPTLPRIQGMPLLQTHQQPALATAQGHEGLVPPPGVTRSEGAPRAAPQPLLQPDPRIPSSAPQAPGLLHAQMSMV